MARLFLALLLLSCTCVHAQTERETRIDTVRHQNGNLKQLIYRSRYAGPEYTKAERFMRGLPTDEPMDRSWRRDSLHRFDLDGRRIALPQPPDKQ